jgi:hypothetical protein
MLVPYVESLRSYTSAPLPQYSISCCVHVLTVARRSPPGWRMYL